MRSLFTPSYCLMLAANFLMFFGFWMLVPVLPFYLAETFAAEGTFIGIINTIGNSSIRKLAASIKQ